MKKDMPDLLGQPFSATQHPHSQDFQTLLGIDYGMSRIGLAVGQTITCTATPIETLHGKDAKVDWQALAGVFKAWKPNAIVIGFPLNVDMSESEMCKPIKQFAKQLQGQFPLPVFFQNEYTSSQEAGTILREQRASGIKNRKTRKGDLDKMAAAIILERWMTEHNQ